MSGKFQTAVVLFMLIEGVALSAGVLAVFGTALEMHAASLMPLVLVLGTALAASLSWLVAPAVDARVAAYGPATPCRLM